MADSNSLCEAEAFEYAARYRTRCAIDATRQRFEAGEVLVYWRYAYSRYDDAQGWFFRQPGGLVVRPYDLYGGERLRRDELFERLEGPRPVVVAAAAGDMAGIERAVAASAPGDPDAALDWELAAERALELDREAGFAALLAVAGFDEAARVRLLRLAAQHGRARSRRCSTRGWQPMRPRRGTRPRWYRPCSAATPTRSPCCSPPAPIPTGRNPAAPPPAGSRAIRGSSKRWAGSARSEPHAAGRSAGVGGEAPEDG